MIYAEAIERQVALLRLFRSARGLAFLSRAFAGKEVRSWAGDPAGPEIASGSATAGHILRVRDNLCQSLEYGESFWWAPELTAAAAEMAATMPSWTLSAEEWPALAGFFWFATPVPLPQHSGKPASPLRALCWRPIGDPDTGRVEGLAVWYFME